MVVDTDETAAKLMKKLEEKNLGRVCFMPLNRLKVKHVNYPDSSDVRPLLEAAITYPREVRPRFSPAGGASRPGSLRACD